MKILNFNKLFLIKLFTVLKENSIPQFFGIRKFSITVLTGKIQFSDFIILTEKRNSLILRFSRKNAIL